MGYMELDLGGKARSFATKQIRARAPDPAAGLEQRLVLQRCWEPSTSWGDGEEAVDEGSAGCSRSLKALGEDVFCSSRRKSTTSSIRCTCPKVHDQVFFY